MKTKKRLDEILHEKGFAETRSKALALIMSGKVFYKNKKGPWTRATKAGIKFSEDEILEFQVEKNNDVGRGAQKLRHAFLIWKAKGLSAQGAKALDVGSSTGGFTQVLLEEGASRVLALDVGKHQLHERLRNDARVFSAEEQHVLKIDKKFWQQSPLKPPFDFATTDLSFISLTKVLSTVFEWLRPEASWVVLLKPQFELEAKKVPKGVVQNESYRQEALEKLRSSVLNIPGLVWVSHEASPLQGSDGNQEYLVWLKKN